MSKSNKRRISPGDTYVLDEKDIKELDDASLTGVMRGVTDTIKELELEQQRRDQELMRDELDEPSNTLGYLVPEE